MLSAAAIDGIVARASATDIVDTCRGIYMFYVNLIKKMYAMACLQPDGCGSRTASVPIQLCSNLSIPYTPQRESTHQVTRHRGSLYSAQRMLKMHSHTAYALSKLQYRQRTDSKPYIVPSRNIKETNIRSITILGSETVRRSCLSSCIRYQPPLHMVP